MKQNSKKKIAVIIVTYNAQDYLPDLFGSLERQDCPGNLVEIVVVDNGSRDGTVEYIKNKFQIPNSKQFKIKLIENKENSGFAKGNNIGIREALKNKSDYIVLLNQDMVVTPNWLDELVRVVENDKKIGAVQPMIMLWDEKDKIQTSGNKIHFLGFGYSGEYRCQMSDVRCQMSDVVYASGAAMLIKREVLEKIGLFDEALRVYHEDLDLGWRMRLAGYQIKVVSKSIVYHKYSFTKNNEKYYLMERNRLIVLLKYYKLLTLILILPTFLFMEFGLWFFVLRSGWGREKLRSYRDFLKTLPQTLIKRKEIQRQRLIKDKDIIKYFTSKVEFEGLKHPLLNHVANPTFNVYWWFIRNLIFW
jgi:GT2 family glycosyltransferase